MSSPVLTRCNALQRVKRVQTQDNATQRAAVGLVEIHLYTFLLIYAVRTDR